MTNSSNDNFLQRRPWVYHVLFWICYYAFAALISLSIHHIFDARFYIQLLSLVPLDIMLVYLNIYLLIPRLLLNRKFALYFFALAVSIFLISIPSLLMHKVYTLAGTRAYAGTGDLTLRNFSVQALNGIYLIGLTTGIKFLKDWMGQRQRLQEQEKQQIMTELNFLKSQVHPHFFFNTLNNLYSLTLQKSDLAPEVVLKLSDLMSYILYESGADTLPLEKEICHLENYIGLEKLRYGNRLSLSFDKQGATSFIRIPPLILLPFVENSFKHGPKNTIGHTCIAISLAVEGELLTFCVSNPIETDKAGAHGTGQEIHGIGLKNVRRRLNLLYGNQHTLDLSDKDGQFHVTLKIPVS